jgi:subtilisin family serine protease
MKITISLLAVFFSYSVSFGQSNVSSQNWHWKDYTKDKVHGISLYQAYQQLAKINKQPSPIIVAVMDGGIDTSHIEIKSKLWTNGKEIPYNGIDDDRNGYVDDIHGWNFLGGKDGRNIDKADAEKTRVYHKFKTLYEGKSIEVTKFNAAQRNQYEMWKQAAAEIEFSEEDAANLRYISIAYKAMLKLGNTLITEIKDSNFNVVTLESFQPQGRNTLDAKMAYLRTIKILGVDKESPYLEIVNELKEYIEGKEKSAKSKTELPDPIRAEIVKDNYENFADKYYGNNDITGPNAKHGTHVAGLVASIPDSSWNVNALYPGIKIMGVRMVPDGDEYDKDVALGIRYAVDNGAKIINMSFGKSFSPEQVWVDNAIRYAASKDVLIIHSAGNEFYDLNVKAVFPSPYSSALNDTASNVLTVAASSDESINNSLLTDFSNFGYKIVDVLSPGNKIYSTLPGKTNHGYLQGTSMAAPIVSHIAAMIRSYYPSLSALDVKKIIMGTVWKPLDENTSYDVPEKQESKTLSSIAAAGGIVNAEKAIQMASQYSPSKLSKTKLLKNTSTH